MEGMKHERMNVFYRRSGKRLLDLAITVPALLLLGPVIGAVAVAIRQKMGRPVLFRQMRPGLHGQPFMMLKFRTMTDARNTQGSPLSDAQRLTRLGRFLRRTSLDELPELWNVLRGEMSLVGPRPLLMQYLSRYTPEQARRHEVRPGITGWAQINGRNALSWEEKFALDSEYVTCYALSMDLRILWLTLLHGWRGEGINQTGEATVREFMGSDGRQ